MALDLQDQQELENFKYWWRKWGRWFTLLFVIVALAYLGNVIWKEHRMRRDGQALTVQAAFRAEGIGQAERLKHLKTLQTEYGDTLPAITATFLEAYRSNVTGRPDVAMNHFKWVVENAKPDSVTRQVALINFAKILANTGGHENVLKVLDDRTIRSSIPDYRPLMREIRANSLLMLGRMDESVAEYDEAIKSIEALKDTHKPVPGADEQVDFSTELDNLHAELRDARDLVVGLSKDPEQAKKFLSVIGDYGNPLADAVQQGAAAETAAAPAEAEAAKADDDAAAASDEKAGLVESTKDAAEKAVEVVKDATAAAGEAATEAEDAVKDAAGGAAEATKDAADKAVEVAKDATAAAGEAAAEAKDAVKDAAAGAAEATKDAAANAAQAAKDAVSGAAEAIKDKAAEAGEAAADPFAEYDKQLENAKDRPALGAGDLDGAPKSDK